MPTAVAAARQSYADHPMVRLETAPPGPCHAVSLQETLSGTFTACATVILGSNAIGEALRKEIRKKTDRRKRLEQDEKYCLVLVDTMGLVDPEDPNQWESCELDAFDSVIIVQLMPERPTEIVAISGDIRVKA